VDAKRKSRPWRAAKGTFERTTKHHETALDTWYCVATCAAFTCAHLFQSLTFEKRDGSTAGGGGVWRRASFQRRSVPAAPSLSTTTGSNGDGTSATEANQEAIN
jgi:hypothetical protein